MAPYDMYSEAEKVGFNKYGFAIGDDAILTIPRVTMSYEMLADRIDRLRQDLMDRDERIENLLASEETLRNRILELEEGFEPQRKAYLQIIKSRDERIEELNRQLDVYYDERSRLLCQIEEYRQQLVTSFDPLR